MEDAKNADKTARIVLMLLSALIARLNFSLINKAYVKSALVSAFNAKIIPLAKYVSPSFIMNPWP
jgi:hypothetical protein